MATSFPTASSLGILANGTDQTSALNTALSNANYQGIIFDYSPAAAVTITGTVTCGGKVLQFLNGNYLTGTGTISGFFIDADYQSKIWDTSLLVKPQGTMNKYYSLKWSGATGNGTTDDWAAIQNDINICTYNGISELYLPSGDYQISKGLLFRHDAGGQYAGLTPPSISTSNFLSAIRLTGEGTAYSGSAGETRIYCNNANSFAIGLQKVKGFRCKGIYCYGVNSGLASYTAYQVLEDTTSTFLTNGSRDNPVSPHCGPNIDPFSSSATITANRYPDFTGYYTETSNGGSSDVEFEDCVFRYFTVGRAVSINGYSQNGEIISFKHCWADFNKVSIATGQSQSRSVFCYDDHVWGGTMIIYDAANYGGGNGAPVTSIGLNAAGGNRYLCALNSWASTGLFVKNAHTEVLWSLGGCFSGVGGNLTIEESWLELTGADPGQSVTQPYTIFNGTTLVVRKSFLFQYDAPVKFPLSINAANASFEDVNFDFIPINNQIPNFTSYTNCNANIGNFGDAAIIGWDLPSRFSGSVQGFTTGMKSVFSLLVSGGRIIKERRKLSSPYMAALSDAGLGNFPRDIIGVPLSATITLTSVTYSTSNTATFNLSPTSVDYMNLLIGDNFIFSTTDEYGNSRALVAFGQITALSSGTVTLGGICKNLNTTSNYQLFIYRNEPLIAQLVLGDTSSGSNIVQNVVFESTSFSVMTNTPVYIPHFPLGTTIASYNGSTHQLTLTNAATITEKNVAIISSNWTGEEIGTVPYLANPYGNGYKTGDRIYNNRTDLYPNIAYWECSKSGITGTANLPKFIAHDGKESTTYNSTSVTAVTDDFNKVVFLNATSNSIAYTIDPVAFQNQGQSIFGILSGSNTITITPASGTINGAASYSLGNNHCIQLYSNGTNFYIIAAS